MYVKVVSIYNNVDDEWLEWWLKRMENEQVMPGCKKIIKELRGKGYARFSSKDPTSKVEAVTTYIINKD